MVGRLLTELEAQGVEQLRLRGDDPLEGVAAELFALGARLVYRLGDAEPGGGLAIMGETSQGGATAPEVIVDVAELHANLPDNRAKLEGAVTASERHLFIWVETSRQEAVAAMSFGVLPERAPELPEFVDAVWVVTAYNRAHIWRYRRDEWLSLGTWTRPDE